MNNREVIDVNAVYNEYLTGYPLGHLAVGWTTKETQYKRFEALFGIGVADNTSLLDYGSGLGHLNDYIDHNGYQGIKYTGIDINPNYVGYSTLRYPDKKFLCSDIENITGYTNSRVSIFNRYGTEVWSVENYDNVNVRFEGKDKNGTLLPEGTYFFLINYGSKEKKGWIELTR